MSGWDHNTVWMLETNQSPRQTGCRAVEAHLVPHWQSRLLGLEDTSLYSYTWITLNQICPVVGHYCKSLSFVQRTVCSETTHTGHSCYLSRQVGPSEDSVTNCGPLLHPCLNQTCFTVVNVESCIWGLSLQIFYLVKMWLLYIYFLVSMFRERYTFLANAALKHRLLSFNLSPPYL